ncbi:enoyl-CoA hydratase/isomerase family protein [Paracoccus denitrificans]|nr:enoyl-CoA hydratase/isomerase family protein [Paracoccus denitrificans]MBB4628944.1 enoyl-CoA hydratase/carnithine racemase [Paracoccus denitrificans]MCU7429935.1 enoyl-CoA hydratase/isomerase family protein [Paracoccus denitrificans]QAR26094.1 enoyl-CoA hydratase/isomerase family protein [Paracoccus denitrificans]UPV96497.1 enoyl-CoA hydratase/isomerase family protein [Paracoccus denitrificans]WQO32936.1 enoyl-CoA hydratase/isomerase family protein [Paracoccus denitrificans]
MIAREFVGGIGRITIARPAKANSLTGAMLADLTAAFDALAAEPGLRAVILTGEGAVFSAGADLDEARAGLALSPEWERLSARVASMPCLTIAALNGTAAGGSLGMVLACDLRLAVPGAKIFYPVMRLGFLPQPSDPVRLRALVGPSRARMILMAGQKIPAEEALAWGLIDRLVAPEALLDEAAALAGDACAADAGHIAAIKRMLD